MSFLLTILLRAIDLYSFLLIIYALLSWFPNAYQTELGRLLIALVEPVLKPFRHFRLQFAGLDFTIIVVIFLLNLLKNLLVRIFLYLL